MLTLYGRANAWNVRKVLFFLEEIGHPYDRLDYGLGFAPLDTPEFLALNPNGMIPVVKDGEVVLWESHTILRYLAAKYAPDSYYPAAQPQRAYVDQWLDWMLAHLTPAVLPLFFYHFLNSAEYGVAQIEEAERNCTKFFGILDGQLGKTGAFVAGPSLTIADCVIGMAVHRWLSLPVEHGDLKNIARYYGALSGLPSYQKTILIGRP